MLVRVGAGVEVLADDSLSFSYMTSLWQVFMMWLVCYFWLGDRGGQVEGSRQRHTYSSRRDDEGGGTPGGKNRERKLKDGRRGGEEEEEGK